MTDYSKLSEFEINRRVLKIVSGKNPVRYAHNADGRSAGIKGDNDRFEWFDFCNSWADAGPIAEKSRIGISPCGDIWHAYSTSEDFVSSLGNPCRAICIVFLMMNEGE